MQPTFNRLRPLLICRDVQAVIRFYVEILDFHVVDRLDDVGLTGWAALARDNIEVMLASPSYIPAPTDTEYPLNQVILYMEVSTLTKLRDDIVAKQYPVGTIEDRFYGMREFEVIDPEGHRITFAENIEED